MNKDLVNKVSVAAGVSAQAVSTDADIVGEIIDTLGAESGMFVYGVGTFATGTLDFSKIEQADDLAFTVNVETITGDSLLNDDVAQIAAADTAVKVGYVASRRFIRLTLTSAATASFVAYADSILGAHHLAPPL